MLPRRSLERDEGQSHPTATTRSLPLGLSQPCEGLEGHRVQNKRGNTALPGEFAIQTHAPAGKGRLGITLKGRVFLSGIKNKPLEFPNRPPRGRLPGLPDKTLGFETGARGPAGRWVLRQPRAGWLAHLQCGWRWPGVWMQGRRGKRDRSLCSWHSVAGLKPRATWLPQVKSLMAILTMSIAYKQKACET